MDEPSSLGDIDAATQNVYERRAAGWDAARPLGLKERPWLDRFLSGLGEAPTVLELGCGAGAPVAGYLIERGCRYTGIDYAEPMLELARTRFSQATFVHADMRDLRIDAPVDGILSWDGSFHLDAEAQVSLLRTMIEGIGSGGALLMTIGDRAGEVVGHVEGEKVYHCSLAPERYRELLAPYFAEIEIVLRDAACGGHSVLLARGRGSAQRS